MPGKHNLIIKLTCKLQSTGEGNWQVYTCLAYSDTTAKKQGFETVSGPAIWDYSWPGERDPSGGSMNPGLKKKARGAPIG